MKRIRNHPHNYKKTYQNITKLLHLTKRPIQNGLDHKGIYIISSPQTRTKLLSLLFKTF